MKRREFITVLAGGAAGWPFLARAQQALPVIGYFGARSAEIDGPMLAAFRQGLNEAGYVEGKNVAIEYRWAGGRHDRLATLAQELVHQQVSVIVTSGGGSAALAAKEATATIPIVFVTGDDPVRSGLVASLNRPGSNLTGVANFLAELGAKQVGLLRELVPTAQAIAILVDPNEGAAQSQVSDAQDAGRALGQQIVALKAGTEAEIDAAFDTLVQRRVDALLVGAGPFFVTHADRLVALAARYAVPTMYFRREYTEAGGLISYGSNIAEGYRQIGVYAAKILKGARPADLPVVRPTTIELVINLKTAKALGLEVPPSLLARADEVIE
jgi:putative tryptophan/tyrosine transport system substrate-binding protein